MNNEIKTTESRGKYFLAAFLAPFIWGFMSIPVRWIRGWPAEDILYFRILTAMLILWIFILIFRRKKLKEDIYHYKELIQKDKRKYVWLTILASLFIFGNWYTYIYCINHISIQAAAFAYMLCPLITTAAAHFILKEELSLIKKIALFFALCSVIMLATGSLIEVLWSIAIGGLYAFYLIIQRVVQGFDKLNILAIQLLLCMVIVVPKLLFNHHALPTAPVFWYTTFIIALLFTIIPLYLSMFALNKISSSTVGIMLYINPIIAFFLAVFYFKEQVDPHKFWAYGLLIIALILFNSKILTKILKG
ncbi:EamA family transporter [Sphingobacterium spiritivorum]|uniref:EamA family transporter n=1 Tax=Sphingobacterium TaxID=28453 RepID=UPI0025EB53F1|nr:MULTISPECIES: EamA family transporter [unclassified Sphingobacterium]